LKHSFQRILPILQYDNFPRHGSFPRVHPSADVLHDAEGLFPTLKVRAFLLYSTHRSHEVVSKPYITSRYKGGPLKKAAYMGICTQCPGQGSRTLTAVNHNTANGALMRSCSPAMGL
jgi:hypothetical protein